MTANQTLGQKAKAAELLQRIKTDSAFKDKWIKRMNTFSTDTFHNNDALLGRAEFGYMMTHIFAHREKLGYFVDFRTEMIDKSYQLCNAMRYEEMGVTRRIFDYFLYLM